MFTRPDFFTDQREGPDLHSIKKDNATGRSLAGNRTDRQVSQVDIERNGLSIGRRYPSPHFLRAIPSMNKGNS